MIEKRVGSLRSTLLYPILWLWLATAMLATLTAFWLSGKAAQAVFDRILKDDALALAAEVQWNDSGPGFKIDANAAASLVFDSLAPSRFTVRTSSGNILVGNAELSVPPGSLVHKAGEPVFFDTDTSWGPLRAVSLLVTQTGRPETVWIIVGEAQSKRAQITQALATAIFLPAAGLGFIVIPLLFVGVRYGLAPARDVSAAVTQRSIDDLSPLPMDNVPDELRGLIGRVNDLLTRLSDAVAHERRFIAEAAHQLRTPTAGIKLLAEDLLRSHTEIPNQPPNTEVLQELLAAASRTSHLVRQLLASARAEHTPAAIEISKLELIELIRRAVDRWRVDATAKQKNITVSYTVLDSPAIWLQISPTLLEEALGNIIENALLHGGNEIEVSLEVSEDNVFVHVLDNGAALDPETMERMFTPFWRGRTSEGRGSGLGLSIAAKATRNLKGDLSAKTRPDVPGTRFTLRLPLPSTG